VQVVEGVKHVIRRLSESSYSAQINNKRIAVLGAYLHCVLLISEVHQQTPLVFLLNVHERMATTFSRRLGASYPR